MLFDRFDVCQLIKDGKKDKNIPTIKELYGQKSYYHIPKRQANTCHDDVIKRRYFPRYWPFVRGIHRSRWIPRTKASDA